MIALRAVWLAFVGCVLVGTAIASVTAEAQGAAQGVSRWQEGRHYRRLSPAVPTNVAPG